MPIVISDELVLEPNGQYLAVIPLDVSTGQIRGEGGVLVEVA